jgi:O-succinylbenzoic acid--CoA ligase
MIPKFTKVHNKFRLNGRHYSFNDLKDVAYSFIKEGETYQKEVGEFILQWTDANHTVAVKTSGSTGKPKTIKLSKQAMVHSAIATGDYFKLRPGNSALMCLPATFIAGKMMIVRALILGLRLDLVEPTSNPLETVRKNYMFSAMVPMQLQNSVNQLYKIKTLIVGGAQVTKELVEKLQESPTTVYATYGMTETITHIAVKKLNKLRKQSAAKYFEVLPKVRISQNKKGCLVIDLPYISKSPMVTNDVVRIHSNTTFELLGRLDNVINSGGIKIQPEPLEAKLASHIKTDFFIGSQENEVFGEEVILVVEGKEQKFSSNIFRDLQKHEIPKKIIFLDVFKRTSSGKINRNKTLEWAKKLS